MVRRPTFERVLFQSVRRFPFKFLSETASRKSQSGNTFGRSMQHPQFAKAPDYSMIPGYPNHRFEQPPAPVIRMTKRLTIRKRVSSACVQCKKSRMRCDDFRPCKRCQRIGKIDRCIQSDGNSGEGDSRVGLSVDQNQASFFPKGNGSVQDSCTKWTSKGFQYGPNSTVIATGHPHEFSSCVLPSLSSLQLIPEFQSIGQPVYPGRCNDSQSSSSLDQLIARKRVELGALLSKLSQAPLAGAPPQFLSSSIPFIPCLLGSNRASWADLALQGTLSTPCFPATSALLFSR